MPFRKLVGSYKDYDISTHIIEHGYLAVDVNTGSLRLGDGTTQGGTIITSGSGGTLTVQEEGSSLSTAATTLNFVGSGVTATGSGGTKTITISGGSSTSLGDLSAVGSTLSAPTNADLTLAVAGTGKVVLTGISFPNSDGSNTQVLATNGSGVLSFVDPVSTNNIDGGTAGSVFDSSLTTIDGGTAA
tara:strand:- start:1333 stop:1893 length:561 start_codon:yes stop_codon:yes gene_type:complete